MSCSPISDHRTLWSDQYLFVIFKNGKPITNASLRKDIERDIFDYCQVYPVIKWEYDLATSKVGTTGLRREGYTRGKPQNGVYCLLKIIHDVLSPRGLKINGRIYYSCDYDTVRESGVLTICDQKIKLYSFFHPRGSQISISPTSKLTNYYFLDIQKYISDLEGTYLSAIPADILNYLHPFVENFEELGSCV